MGHGSRRFRRAWSAAERTGTPSVFGVCGAFLTVVAVQQVSRVCAVCLVHVVIRRVCVGFLRAARVEPLRLYPQRALRFWRDDSSRWRRSRLAAGFRSASYRYTPPQISARGREGGMNACSVSFIVVFCWGKSGSREWLLPLVVGELVGQ